MGLNSVKAYTKQAGKGYSGGVQKLWAIAYSDLATVTGSTEVYTTASGTTQINAIGLASGATFTSIGLLRENASFKGTAKRDASTGAFDNSIEVGFSISNITDTAKQFVDSLSYAPVALLIKLRSGNYVVTGLNGTMEFSEATEDSGTKNGDFVGYLIKVMGFEDGFTKTVDPALIASIVDKL
ncbi:hypothetical protein BDD43_2843 [Mucilaginibacter gracilis]|uniref:Tail tube protein n=1 Tax=Mucilaginibacter gracilis TaxID=423350 RepID=A0A495J2Q7_9SPHI|nr:hypothetical protein [Mucilaginibacter gracilis]RKR82658.1 hypothetical protein BDD43_2843 [Mucilaginibacter gracilis]